jgi:uncharacterized lipoprotein YmbA
MKIRFLIALALIMVAGCAGKPPETSWFLLRGDAMSTASMSQSDIGVGRVEVAKYLDQAGIIIETDPGQIHVARLNLWAEPLQKSIRSTLATQLSTALGSRVQDDASRRSSWRLQVDVKIDQFHGTHDGKAVLVASWWVSDVSSDDIVAEGRFASSSASSDSGYAELVKNERALLDEMAGDIGKAISGIASE